MPLFIFLQATLIMLAYMSTMFIIAHIKKDNSIVDVAWGGGFVLVTLIALIKTSLYLSTQLLVTTLVIIWALRISGYIFIRNLGKKEDQRYQQMRERWGNKAILYSFIYVFMFQGFLIMIISLPVFFINTSTVNSLLVPTIIGCILWLTGFLFETIGDWQIFIFLRNPNNKGQLMTSGLWRYTRHPNYFGEITLWWGIWLIAAGIPGGWITIIGPLTITYLLIFVSGVPMAEKQITHLPGFEEYKQQTSVLIPWFVKK